MKKKSNLKNFAGWTSFNVEDLLGYQRKLKMPELTEWLRVEGEIPANRRDYLEERRLELMIYQNVWNEIDILYNFIGPLLTTLNFRGEGFNHFCERTLEAEIGDYRVNGVVDWMAATGRDEPEIPFFFLHEYKKMKGTDAEPLGQLLIGMVAVQALNKTQTYEPIFGCYVIGTYWRFVYLQEKNYDVSEGFDATDEKELQRIWLILNKTKEIIAEKALVLWNKKMEAFRS